jgi:hypothetical protein
MSGLVDITLNKFQLFLSYWHEEFFFLFWIIIKFNIIIIVLIIIKLI